MRVVPEPQGDSHSIVAGPLRARLSTEGVLRIGWDEPDWLGPATLHVPGARESPMVWAADDRPLMSAGMDGISSSVSALPGEPVILVDLEASEARGGIGTGDFAMPGVAWHFRPSDREAGGAPAGLRAFGHQYTEFALPVFSDEALSRWRPLQKQNTN